MSHLRAYAGYIDSKDRILQSSSGGGVQHLLSTF